MLFFVESGEMLQQWHTAERVSAVLTTSGHRGVRRRWSHAALVPVDWVRWSADTHKALTQIASRARPAASARRDWSWR